uniref:C-type lectin domain-containing protein n=1 Tax=Periophthalmus magnuspinnatus TaxID=409849 RepID=A0A3B4AFI2_9GOBI
MAQGFCVKSWTSSTPHTLYNPVIIYISPSLFHIRISKSSIGTTSPIFSDSSSKQFILVSVLLSWEDARSYCRQQYTDLAMIEDETENSAVAALMWGGSVWIGLYREGWQWSDGSNSTFTNWANGQPDLGVQNCVVETAARDWHDGWCHDSYPFICQKGHDCSIVFSTVMTNSLCVFNIV